MRDSLIHMDDLAALNVLGVMSGTSLDGMDAVLVRLVRAQGKFSWQVLARASRPYPRELLADLRACLRLEADVRLITQVHAEVGLAYADIVQTIQQRHTVDVVALSGQTVYHIPRPDKTRNWRIPSTLQLGDAARVSETCGVVTYADFRSADMAAGGQGAPLVAFADAQLFSQPGVTRSVHNLGGISNLTLLPGDGKLDKIIAFDTGPANCLMDEAAQRHFGLEYDSNGDLAAQGRVNETVLAQLMTHPYLRLAPPKTTGREVFTLAGLTDYGLEDLSSHDLMATLTAFSATSIADAYQRYATGAQEVLVAGGGALNETLVRMIKERLQLPLYTFEDNAMNSRDREAVAFAVLGYFAHLGLPNTLPQATGAKRAVVAGKRSSV